jgi:hypothetical protein
LSSKDVVKFDEKLPTAGVQGYTVSFQRKVREPSRMAHHSKPEAKNSTYTGRFPNFLVYWLQARRFNQVPDQ